MTDWSSYATTIVKSDQEAIRHIARLNLDGAPFHLDPTYSKGVFWRGLPQPLLKYDKYPQDADVLQGDARCLPLPDQSVSSIMFDPPFVAKNTTTRVPNGKIEMRFGGYATVAELWQFYRDALVEFRRLLQPSGVLVFKCQDMVSGGKQHWSHCEIWRMATSMGYSAKDLYIKHNPRVLWSPNMASQQHARRTHSYFWVFVK